MLLGNETRNDSGLSLSLSTTLCVFVCSKDNPAANCQEIYKKDAGAVSGAYWIKGKGKPFQVSMLPQPKSFFSGGGGRGDHSYQSHTKYISNIHSAFLKTRSRFITTFLSCWAFSPNCLYIPQLECFFFLSS